MTQDAPVGFIAPFAGDVYDSDVAAGLKNQGWLPCIGLSLPEGEYRELFDMIGTLYGGGGGYFNLPDLRGLFVSGASEIFPPGEVRKYTTAKPSQPLLTSTDGEHSHTLRYVPTEHSTSDYCAGHNNSKWNSGTVSLSLAGSHSHTVDSGGDPESRPLNLALDHIIRFKTA